MNEASETLLTFDRALGFISFILTIFIYFRQTKAQNKFEQFSKDTFLLLKEQGALSQHHLVSLRTDLLLLFQEQAENKSGFWHFKLRFEYWNDLGIWINSNDKVQHIDIRVLGQTIDHVKEASSIDRNAYICEVREISGSQILSIGKGDKVVCFAKGEKKCISKFYHPIVEPEEYFEFGISRLGNIVTGSKNEVPASQLKIHPRMKDSIKG